MKIGAVSDSHNYLTICAWRKKANSKIPTHLGDDYDDTQVIESPGIVIFPRKSGHNGELVVA